MTFTLSITMQTPPILHLDLSGEIQRDEFETQIDALDDLIKQQGWQDKLVYLIVDARKVQTTFATVMGVASAHNKRRGQRGSASDPQLFACMIGNSALLKLVTQMLGNFIRRMIMFETQEQALAFFVEHYHINNLKE